MREKEKIVVISTTKYLINGCGIFFSKRRENKHKRKEGEKEIEREGKKERR